MLSPERVPYMSAVVDDDARRISATYPSLLFPYVCRLSGVKGVRQVLEGTSDAADLHWKVRYFADRVRRTIASAKDPHQPRTVTVRQATGDARITNRQLVCSLSIDAGRITREYHGHDAVPPWLPAKFERAWEHMWGDYWGWRLGNILLGLCHAYETPAGSPKSMIWHPNTEAECAAYRTHVVRRFCGILCDAGTSGATIDGAFAMHVAQAAKLLNLRANAADEMARSVTPGIGLRADGSSNDDAAAANANDIIAGLETGLSSRNPDWRPE